MNVTCVECQSVFRVDPAKVPAGGVRARCAVCGGVMPIDAPSAGGEEWGSAAPLAVAASAASAAPAAARAPTPPPVEPMAPVAPVPPVAPVAPMAWTPPAGPPARGLTPWEGLPTVQTSTSGGVAPRMPGAPMMPGAPAMPAAPMRPAASLTPAAAGPIPVAPPVAPMRPVDAPARAAAPPPVGAEDAHGRVTPFPSPSFVSPPTPFGGVAAQRPLTEPPRLGPSPFEAADGDLAGGSAGDVGSAWWATQGIGNPAAGAPPAPAATPAAPMSSLPSLPSLPSLSSMPAMPSMPAVPPVAPAQPTPHPFGGVPVSGSPFGLPAAATPASITPASGARAPINPFLANDPNAKARRLARALVSDMITYHPQLRDQAAREGTLKQAFKEEIKKSYEEYVEQVGREFAETTAHFQDALNDILASGRKLF